MHETHYNRNNTTSLVKFLKALNNTNILMKMKYVYTYPLAVIYDSYSIFWL